MSEVIDQLYKVIDSRLKEMPEGSYTASLAKKGKSHVARKVGEEAVEVVVASLWEGRERLISEVADLMYHLLVLMAMEDVKPEDIYEELRRRMK